MSSRTRVVIVAAACAIGGFAPGAAAGQAMPSASEARADLGSSDATVRATAACHLGRMKADDVRPVRDDLIRMLSDGARVEGDLCRDYQWGGPDDEGSTPGREAALALEELGTEVFDDVVEVLGGSNAVGRENAALTLGLIESPRAIGRLERALSDDVARVRARSAWALGMIEHPDAVPALGRTLRADSDAETRSQAAWALGMIEDPTGVAALVASMDDNEASVRSQAAWGLGMIEHPDGVPGLVDAVRDADARVRSQAAWALGMIEHRDGVAPLRVALGDSDAKVRSQAAWGLGMIEDSGGVAGLVDALRDPDAGVRSQAAWALGMIESRQATAGLARALGSDAEAKVRSQAAWALGMIEDPAATDALLEALEDEDEDVQDQAMWALSQVIRTGGFGDVDRSDLADRLRRALRRDPVLEM